MRKKAHPSAQIRQISLSPKRQLSFRRKALQHQALDDVEVKNVFMGVFFPPSVYFNHRARVGAFKRIAPGEFHFFQDNNFRILPAHTSGAGGLM